MRELLGVASCFKMDSSIDTTHRRALLPGCLILNAALTPNGALSLKGRLSNAHSTQRMA